MCIWVLATKLKIYVCTTKYCSLSLIMNIDNSTQKHLTQVIRQAPNREWMEQYLDLIEEVIHIGRFENDDPRFVLSINSAKKFSVTINGRYVLSAFRKGRPLVGFTLPYGFEGLSELISRSEMPEFRSRQWKPHAGEVAEKCPYFLAFEGFPERLLTIKQKIAWKRAVLDEMERCDKSPYKRFHKPFLYELVIDLGFRKLSLDEIFYDDYSDEVNSKEIFQEGSVRQVLTKYYERNSKARQKCIDRYGTSCSVCDFNFGKSFGELGEGFIHVHHLRPIFEIAEEYEVDPIKDLRPVCPNCHAMIHRSSSPLSIEELKSRLIRFKAQTDT